MTIFNDEILNKKSQNSPLTTDEIISYLNGKYKSRQFSISKKEDCGIDDEGAPDQLISFEDEGMDIINPSFSSCSRFVVDPMETYGIEKEDADLINKHNNLSM